jgi:mevalonate kinase
VRPITTRAPAKVILFGEHAVNRGQPALATSVGLYVTCRLSGTLGPPPDPDVPLLPPAPSASPAASAGGGIALRATSTATSSHPGGPTGSSTRREEVTTRAEVLRLGREIDAWRAAGDLEPIRRLAGADYFAPAKYVLAGALGEALPEELAIDLASEVPRAGGLGSGGAAFAALATALAAWTEDDGANGMESTGTAPDDPQRRERVGGWAHRGDVVAHGGVASRLDTQASLCGGVIRFTVAAGIGEPVPYDPALPLVIGDTGTAARTSEVNSRLRVWLASRPEARMPLFGAMGALAAGALRPLRTGDWAQLGHLMTLNQVMLEKIRVSSPEIERLVEGALEGGALGAKLAGSGGGGIILALAPPQRRQEVAQAIARAGGAALTPALAVPGAQVLPAGESR